MVSAFGIEPYTVGRRFRLPKRRPKASGGLCPPLEIGHSQKAISTRRANTVASGGDGGERLGGEREFRGLQFRGDSS